jgi:ABC-type spermidine/putrescine transport system permease subunit II
LAVNLWLAEFVPTSLILDSLRIVLIAVIAAHLWGAYLHLAGVGKRVGGQKLHNHMIGPPVILPMIVATVAALDLLRLLLGNLP